MEFLFGERKGSWILVSNGNSSPNNLARITETIAEAALRSRRSQGDVTVIAVSKTRTVKEIKAVLAAGITNLGENRIQELKEKWSEIGKTATWHLIGSLQTNKVKQALEMADLIHSLDRPALADELDRVAGLRGKPCQVLVQVNVSNENSKHGVSVNGLRALLEHVSQKEWVRVQGLMTMAPFSDEPETARPYFRTLRELAEQTRTLALPNVEMRHLSMGMSGDFAVAVEEGATLVRIGTAIFGDRQ